MCYLFWVNLLSDYINKCILAKKNWFLYSFRHDRGSSLSSVMFLFCQGGFSSTISWINELFLIDSGAKQAKKKDGCKCHLLVILVNLCLPWRTGICPKLMWIQTYRRWNRILDYMCTFRVLRTLKGQFTQITNGT